MKIRERLSRVLPWLEIAVACILFFSMLITCGLYINIKMNGKISSLPSLPEKDKRALLRAVASDMVSYDDDLLEPVFVGFKNGRSMVSASFGNELRRTAENSVYGSLYALFSGTHEKRNFNSAFDAVNYIEGLKSSDTYMLISFFCDMPSAVILPCISESFEVQNSSTDSFMIKHLFLLPDINENLYGVSVNEHNEIYILHPESSISYGKIVSESYDISDGYSYFEYLNRDGVYPVISSSFEVTDYSVEPKASLYGMDVSEGWVNNLFDVFNINSSLVRSFTSGDKTETNHIDEQSELVLKLDGSVVYTSTEGDGIYLEELLGYFPHNSDGYNNSDRLFAVKSIINSLRQKNDLFSYTITGIESSPEMNESVFYLKLLVDGILISEREYDAKFVFAGDCLKKAEFYSFACKRIEDRKQVLPPQKYLSIAGDEMSASVYCPVLSDTDEPNIKHVKWAGFYSEKTEVAG